MPPSYPPEWTPLQRAEEDIKRLRARVFLSEKELDKYNFIVNHQHKDRLNNLEEQVNNLTAAVTRNQQTGGGRAPQLRAPFEGIAHSLSQRRRRSRIRSRKSRRIRRRRKT